MLAEQVKALIETSGTGKKPLEHEVKALLKDIGLPVPQSLFVGRDAVFSSPENLTYPLVAKVSSSAISSKSDVRGIRIDIQNEDELRTSVEELFRISHAEGVLIEEMAPPGVEVIVGGLIDRQFGPVVMFGLGGLLVELFRDVAFGLAPMNRSDAEKLIRQVKGHTLLEGYRGKQPVDSAALLSIVVAVSDLIATGFITEIDLNPVVLYPDGALILDAKISPC